MMGEGRIRSSGFHQEESCMDGVLLVAAGLLFCWADLDSACAWLAGMLLVFAGTLRATDASPYWGLVSVVLVGAAVTTATLRCLLRPQGPGMWTVLARKVEEDRPRGRPPGG